MPPTAQVRVRRESAHGRRGGACGLVVANRPARLEPPHINPSKRVGGQASPTVSPPERSRIRRPLKPATLGRSSHAVTGLAVCGQLSGLTVSGTCAGWSRSAVSGTRVGRARPVGPDRPGAARLSGFRGGGGRHLGQRRGVAAAGRGVRRGPGRARAGGGTARGWLARFAAAVMGAVLGRSRTPDKWRAGRSGRSCRMVTRFQRLASAACGESGENGVCGCHHAARWPRRDRAVEVPGEHR